MLCGCGSERGRGWISVERLRSRAPTKSLYEKSRLGGYGNMHVYKIARRISGDMEHMKVGQSYSRSASCKCYSGMQVCRCALYASVHTGSSGCQAQQPESAPRAKRQDTDALKVCVFRQKDKHGRGRQQARPTAQLPPDFNLRILDHHDICIDHRTLDDARDPSSLINRLAQPSRCVKSYV